MNALIMIHVAVSLVGIASGLIVLAGLLRARRMERWTALFLWSTVLTSLSGFILPADKLLPSHVVGILSLLILAAALYALHRRRLAGRWRVTYVLTAVAALYLNVFVLVVQLFLKVPALKTLAPAQTEPPFVITQVVVLAVFVALGIAAAIRFRQSTIQ